MSLTSQQYADLTEHSYGEKRNGRRGQLRHNVDTSFELGGVSYKVLEYMDSPSGYQGVIYQRLDTGDIVVSHRGTEFDREFIKDGAITDGGMAMKRRNAQADDAIELVRRALNYAKDPDNVKKYGHISEVTVTGHSLGGTLVQITTNKFDLRGETFNAYGAVSLGYGLPEGGNQVINHVMASDPVSAASHHFGEVRMYASERDVKHVAEWGHYDNDHDRLDARNQAVAVVGSLGAHSMHNFTNRDGDDKPDRSILADPHARQLANEYAPMFGKFRSDIYVARAGVSLASDVAFAAREIAGHNAGQVLQRSGHAVAMASYQGAGQSRDTAHLMGGLTAASVHQSGHLLADARETAAVFEARIDLAQGHMQRQSAELGASVLHGIGNLLPEGGERWIHKNAERLRQVGEQAQQDNHAQAASALQSGRHDATDIRDTSHKIQAGIADTALGAGELQHRVIASTGARAGVTLEAAGQLTEAMTRRPAPHTEQAAFKEPVATRDGGQNMQPQNTPDAMTQMSVLSARLDRMLAAGQSENWTMFRQETQLLANGEAGQTMRNQAVAAVDQQEQQAMQQPAMRSQAIQQVMQSEAPAHPPMRLH